MNNHLLSINNLKTHFNTDGGVVKAVNGVSFNLKNGETLGIVGESGSGKSMLAMSIMGLIPSPPGQIEGEIKFKGTDLVQLHESNYRKIRGNDIAMIFQEPMTSLNPILTIGKQITEVYKYHQKLSPKKAKEKAIEMLRLVGIPKPEDRFNDFPHLLSGGMRQRVMIAIALACNPELLIADEPTTALDVTIQAQVLELMEDLKKDFNTSLIMISHDFGVVSKVADRILIMYAGKKDVFTNPSHPYTEVLLQSIPNISTPIDHLKTIPGTVPHPQNFPEGCPFHPRCKDVMPICTEKRPILKNIDQETQVSCWKY